MPSVRNISFFCGGNAEFVEEMFIRYLQGDELVGEDCNRIAWIDVGTESCTVSHVICYLWIG